MLKFGATTPEGELYGLGLSHENLARLKAGEAIRVDLATLGGEGVVLLFAGRDEGEMVEQLIDAGVVGPDTELKAL